MSFSLPKIFLPLILSSLCFVAGASQEKRVEVNKSIDLLIGETPVIINCYRVGESKVVYFNMHDDENTAVEAIGKFLTEHDGYFVELKARGDRFVSFRQNQTDYRFDPNRIFTDAGIENTKAPYQEIRRFVDTLFTLLFVDGYKFIVTLHNNTEGDFSALSYAAGQPLEKNVREYNINPGLDADDFYYVTEPWLFSVLKSRNENVVLQDSASVEDDGSFSVYCGRNSIPYVNVEAQQDHLEEQIRMITLLQEILAAKEAGR
jgi:hypothetical protein